MEWLNYHHLLYFWQVVRQGGVARAAAEMRRSQPTVSAQVHELEEALGEPLFDRRGRSRVLTDTGQQVYRYADEIFSLGRELVDAVKGRPTGRPLRLVVGIADVVPKLVARRLLDPAVRGGGTLRLVCREDKPDRLLAALALNELDLVLSDAPAGPSDGVRAFNHLLGECGITFFGTGRHRRLRRDFPKSLEGVDLLVPTANTNLRRSLEQWFDRCGVRPNVVGEFEDSALLYVFGQSGRGVFAAHSVIEGEVRRQFGVSVIGRTDRVRERFYAISVERRLKHPAVVAITESARREIFQ